MMRLVPFVSLLMATSVRAQSHDPAVLPVDSAYLQRVVYDLAADSMMGRDTRRPEIVQAARYIEDEFIGAGLSVPPGGKMLQWWGAYDQVRDIPVHGPNVVGWLEGSDPVLASEYVLFVAHFDHLPPDSRFRGDSIRNGADDNASGTAGLLALARAFGQLQPPLPRSLVFLAVSGEERGLLGSQAYVASPAFPLEELHAVINLDMIGRYDNGCIWISYASDSVYGPMAGTLLIEHPDLRLTVRQNASSWDLRDTDSWSFRHQTREVISIDDGYHKDAHTVRDEADRLDYGILTRVTRLAYLLGLKIASHGMLH